MKSFLESYAPELITEGIHDPAKFKAVFLAGGPGSGKSYVAKKLALKTLGMTEINSDVAFEHMMAKRGLDPKMPDHEAKARDAVRQRAKKTVDVKQKLAIHGRQGVVIDGTGKDYEKLAQLHHHFKSLGYDTKMVFVNTKASTAHERNERRPRVVPKHIVQKSWEGVQNNLGKYQRIFGPEHLHIVNNDTEDVDNLNHTHRKIRAWAAQAPQSQLAKQWKTEEAKRRGIQEPKR